MALCQLLGKLRDARGKITIPGFYDEVVKLTAYERRQLAKLPTKPNAYRKFLGVPELFGEKGFTADEQRTARPTLEINGLTSGYQGDGSKTIIPSWAKAKLTLRLVPNQTPKQIIAQVTRHLKKLCPPTVKLTVTPGHGGTPYLVSPTSQLAQGALRALEAGFGHEAILTREGGSIPIVAAFKKHLDADTLLLGMALPDDNPHSPNEKFSLDAYAAGMRMSAHLWPELSCAAFACDCGSDHC
jgi:succinyl-diaminopimelate desuccinylase